jgi:hypothetical protein
MLSAQMIAANAAALDLYRRAWIPEQSFEVSTRYLALADKAARTLALSSSRQRPTADHCEARHRERRPGRHRGHRGGRQQGTLETSNDGNKWSRMQHLSVYFCR